MDDEKKNLDIDPQADPDIDETEDRNEKIIKGYASEREAHEVMNDKKDS